MSISAVVEALFESGASKEMIVAAVRAYEAAMPAPPPAETPEERARRKARERQARYDEKKRQKPSETVRKASEPSELTLSDDPSPSLPPSPRTPQPPTHPPVEKTTRTRAAKRAPEDWAPSAKTLTTLEAEGYSPGQIERELTMIRDHTFATARSDWDASFRNWVRKKPPTNKPAKPNGLFDDRPDPRSTQRTDRLDRMLAGALDAVDQQS